MNLRLYVANIILMSGFFVNSGHSSFVVNIEYNPQMKDMYQESIINKLNCVNPYTQEECLIAYEEMLNNEKTGQFNKRSMFIAALGGYPYAQEQLACYFADNKKYDQAAKWYVESAKNGNSDTLSCLLQNNLLDENEEIDTPNVKSKLIKYWKDE